MKKKLSAILVTTLLILMIPMSGKAADNALWTKVAYNEWNYQDELEGTNLTVKYNQDTHTLTVTGVGAIPGYYSGCQGYRPWDKCPIWYINLGTGITSIGSYAFEGYPCLMKVNMYVNTFIEHETAFGGAMKECMFDIKGFDMQERQNGRFTYTSLDSIVKFMQHYNGIYRYRLENDYMVKLAQNNTSPAIKNLAPMAISEVTNEKYPLINYQASISCNAYDENAVFKMTGERQEDDRLKVFEQYMGDYNYINAYRVSVFDKTTIFSTSKAHEYTMTIPNAYKFPGRTFALIQMADGQINVLQDIDMSDETITFKTYWPTGLYAMIYKDNFVISQ